VLRYKPLVMGLPIQAAVDAAVDSAANATLFARDWRNHLIAHRDFSHAQDPAAKPLAAGSRASVEEALHAIHDLMQILEGRFRDVEVSYQVTRSAQGGAWDLLYHLDGGLEVIRSRRVEHIYWEPKYL